MYGASSAGLQLICVCVNVHMCLFMQTERDVYVGGKIVLYFFSPKTSVEKVVFNGQAKNFRFLTVITVKDA